MSLVLVSTVTVGAGGAASIEFTGIPATGTDLLVVFSLRDTSTTTGVVQYDLNTGGSATGIVLRGDGASVTSISSDPATLGRIPTANLTSNTFGNGSMLIANYTSSIAKSISADVVSENNATTAWQYIGAFSKSVLAPITSVKLTPWNTFAQYSTASLYTITKGSGGATVA